MSDTVRIGISACLLGENVRYDGGHKLDHYLKETLGKFVEWMPVCPEVEYGLPVPREAMRLVGDPDNPRLLTRKTLIDHTDGMLAWTQKKLKELEGQDLCGFIFKSRSPSSGIQGVKIYSTEGMPVKTGAGIFGGAFVKSFPLIPAEDDGRFHDPALRENFIERIFAFRRWKDLIRGKRTTGGLVSFHTDHKLLLMAHSPKHYTTLGRLVAGASKRPVEELFSEYISLFMEGLRMAATVKKNTNVLQHIAGYFRPHLSAEEREELKDIIVNYHGGLIPLIVPVTLINHYVRKYGEEYLGRQVYLNPHPLELMLRNHV